MRPRLRSIAKLANGHTLLQLQGRPSVTYRIDGSTNLPAWSPLGSVPSGPGGSFSFEDATMPAPRFRFYRAVAP
jgi:hypothetical protein